MNIPSSVLALSLAGAAALATAAPVLAQGTQNLGRRSVPRNTVVRVTLEEELSSRTSRVGDRFMARLSDRDFSGFPRGTRFEGSVTQVERPSSDRPGVLDMKVHRAIMPDGRAVAATAFLASLNDNDVTRVGRGRLETRSRSRGERFEWKWVGYGAAGGAVLGEILGGNFLRGAILGGLGGAVYSYINRDRGRRGDYRDVELERGKEFGLRLHEQVVFNDREAYRYARYDDRRNGGRYEGRYEDDRYDRDRDDRDDRDGDDRYDREYDDRDDVEEHHSRRDRDTEEQDRYPDDERYGDEDRYPDDERQRDDRDARYERGGRVAR